MSEARAIEVVITPTDAQYRELVEHLAVLREAGATSNTAAILAAVRESAGKVRPTQHLREAA